MSRADELIAAGYEAGLKMSDRVVAAATKAAPKWYQIRRRRRSQRDRSSLTWLARAEPAADRTQRAGATQHTEPLAVASGSCHSTEVLRLNIRLDIDLCLTMSRRHLNPWNQ